MHQNVKKLCVLAMISALAFVMVAVIRFPVVLFLKYEPKDVIITVGGFLYGPLATMIVSVVVSLIEMLTISDTGWIGFVMNVLSTVAFAGTASFMYKKKHSISGAVLGLVLGTVLMTGLMLLWNYVLTPLYMNQARADVDAMLVPVFLPFNLLKGVLNSTITILLYRPLVNALRGAKLFPQSTAAHRTATASKVWLYIVTSLVFAIAVVLVILFRKGVL